MATGKITKASVDGLAPSTRTEFLWDDGLRGFGVKLTPAGGRSYIYQFRLGGRGSPTRRYSIGTHGSPWTPTLARKEAERLAILVAQGIDPIGELAERNRISVDLAFKTYAESFSESCKGEGWRQLVARTLRLHVTPYLKNKPLPAIKKSDIAGLLDRLPSDQLALKRNTFAVVRRLFRWAISRGDLERSPCEGMETPPAVTARDRVLTDSELAIVWQAAASAGKLFGPIVRLLIATGQRREEVTQINWAELDQPSMTWTLPKERAKNGVAHMIPLNLLAVEILDGLAIKGRWPLSGRVFMTNGAKPYTAHARGKVRLDNFATVISGGPLLPWRLHDLRRTMATNFQRLGVRFEVTEAALNHVGSSRSGVAGVYQRHDWLEEKKAAFDSWSEHLQAILKARNDNADLVATELV